MKTDFTQPFERSKTTTVLLLIEVDTDVFLQLTHNDNLDAFYATSLGFELDNNSDTTLQLAHFLHSNNLELKHYRHILQETSAEFSYIDDTPGISKDTVCLHVVAEMTSQPIPTPNEYNAELISLEQFLANSRRTGIPTGILETAASQLFIERQII